MLMASFFALAVACYVLALYSLGERETTIAV